MPRHSSFAIPAILIFLGLPASAQGGREAQLLSDRPAPRRSCQVVREPRTLPTVASLGDYAALLQQMEAFTRDHPTRGDSTPYAVYSVTVRDGRVRTLRGIEYFLPAGRDGELAATLRDAMGASDLPDGTFRVRVDLGERPLVRVGRSERCPPELPTRFRVQSMAVLNGPAPRAVRVRMLVNADGQIMNVILLGNSGRPDFDRFLQESLRGRQIPPGLLDGEPVQMEHEQLIQFATRG